MHSMNSMSSEQLGLCVSNLAGMLRRPPLQLQKGSMGKTLWHWDKRWWIAAPKDFCVQQYVDKRLGTLVASPARDNVNQLIIIML